MTLPKSRKRVDSAWSWLVCFCSTIIIALTLGTALNFGILFPVLMAYFQETRERTGKFITALILASLSSFPCCRYRDKSPKHIFPILKFSSRTNFNPVPLQYKTSCHWPYGGRSRNKNNVCHWTITVSIRLVLLKRKIRFKRNVCNELATDLMSSYPQRYDKNWRCRLTYIHRMTG